MAKRLAPMAEEIHKKLVPILEHELDLKTNVVLLDTVDYGNGFASVFPNPRIILYLTDWSTNLNPSKHELWLKFLFLHEYAHILHLDIADGGMLFYRKILGRAIFPNGIAPLFIIEGLATYMETKYTQGGRGTDPRFEMVMRMDVLEDKVKSIDQASVSTVAWPRGHVRYIYGVEFLEYLTEAYGEYKLVDLLHIYGDYLFSLGIDSAFYYIYDKNLSTLWREWLVYSRRKYEQQKKSLGQLTEPRLVTHTGYQNLKPKWSKDSRSIYYQQTNADGYPSLRVINLEKGKDDQLLEAWVFTNNLSLDPSGTKLLFSKLDKFKNYYTYKDLYTLDLRNKRTTRLTEGMRADDADFSRDGSKIVFVKNELGTRSLMVVSNTGGDLRPLLLGGYDQDVQYYSPRWSPSGRMIAVAKWTRGGQQKIYLINLDTGKQERLTTENNLDSEANPSFSPKGKYVLFDSDRTGIVNLYAFHLGSKRMFQITNVLGGAMMPDISPDGKKIAYVSYSSKGYDIAVMDIKPSEWKEVSMTRGGSPAPKAKDDISGKYDIHDYDPIPSLMPKFWLPFEYTNENGSQFSIYTRGFDALNQHYYTLSLGYDWQADKAQYSLLYANNQFLPEIVLQYSDASVPYSWGGETLWMSQKFGQIYFSLYDNRVFYEWDRQALYLGYQQTNIGNISSIESLATPPSLGNINGVFLVWRYLNSRRYAKSISPEDGIDLTLRIGMNTADLGSDYTYTTYSGNAAAYFRAPLSHHILSPTLYGFYSKGDQLAQSNFTWEYLPIRGYPSTNLLGNKGALLSTEYRFPLWYLERGIMHGYAFFDRIWADVFYELGGATFNQVADLKLKRSYGMVLNLSTLSLWSQRSTLKLVYAKGLDEGGEDKFYLAIGL